MYTVTTSLTSLTDGKGIPCSFSDEMGVSVKNLGTTALNSFFVKAKVYDSPDCPWVVLGDSVDDYTPSNQFINEAVGNNPFDLAQNEEVFLSFKTSSFSLLEIQATVASGSTELSVFYGGRR